MEGGRKEGSEGRGGGRETGLGSAPAQTLPSMMWNGKGGFFFTHKGDHFTIKLFTVFGVAAKSLTAAATRACRGCISIVGLFLAAFAQIFAW